MILKEAIAYLSDAGIDSADYDARELFRSFGGFDRHELILANTESNSRELLEAIERRHAHEPLQYILGSCGFYREVYEVTPDCLIPRYDTEILVDYAVRSIPDGENLADVCCGSGCIGISVLKNSGAASCLSIDISEGAIELTRRNAEKNSVSDRLTTLNDDVLRDGFALGEKFYAILSNPPYIPKSVYEGLEDEIFHEPRLAFVGGDDGETFYKVLTPIFLDALKDGGFIAFEIGYDQAELLRGLADKYGVTCEIIKDYSQNDRVAVLKK